VVTGSQMLVPFLSSLQSSLSSPVPSHRICGYFDKSSRSRTVNRRISRQNIKEGLLEKSKLAQRACEDGHNVGWDEDRILEIEINSRYRK
jgi:hypothetical protein